MKLGADIPAETKISIKHKEEKSVPLPRIYGLKPMCSHFFTSIWFVLDIPNVITDLQFH